MNRDIFEVVVDTLKSGKNAILVTLCATDGSTPRKGGAKMIVFPDGSIRGTIGGGALEHQAIEKAREVFSTKKSLFLHCDLEDLGMVCGGQGTVFLEYL